MVESPPTEQELAEFYDGFLEDYHGGGGERGAADRQRLWALAYLQILQRYAPTGRVMDVGAANSPFANLAKAAGYDVAVMDFKRPRDLDAAIPFSAGSLNDDPASLVEHREKYDVVTSWAVLEHCLDSHRAAEILVSFCKPGGVVIVTSPEVGSIADAHGAGRTSQFYPPQHIYLISPKGLRSLFERHGAQLIRNRKFEYSKGRWLIRYSLTAAEGVGGYVLERLMPARWRRMRESRLTKATGVTLCVFQKPA